MARDSQINLFKSQSPVTPELLDKMALFRKYGIIAIIVTVVLGVAISFIYGALATQKSLLNSTQKQLTKQIESQSQKEGLFMTLKQRITSIKNIRSSTIAWQSVIDTASSIATPPVLQTIRVGEMDRTEMMVRPASIAETLTIVTNIVSRARENKLRDPRLISFTIGKDGIQISF
jgi:hypothetical protein